VIAALLVVGAFLLGSIPFGVIVARLKGVDVTKVGSGNIGATNVARAVGKPLGVVVLLLDAAKAGVPIFVVSQRPWLEVAEQPWILAAMGVAAVLGHILPPWLKFRGGKGVATALGVFLALAPKAALLAAVAWLLIYAATRLSSLGSLVGAAVLTTYLIVTGAPIAYTALAATLDVFIIVRHRGNIARLVRREEKKV
jgi:glycerol-3-phosphate acyltransferase PlsY